MNAFHTIAVPHDDILQGRLTLDVFAADLWEVKQSRAPDEYQDAKLFFAKTYMTNGLQNLLTIINKRLEGKGGDPVIQVKTPFGGGKTHSLIALYHKAKEWKARTVIAVGTAMNAAEDTLWGIIEQQLTQKITRFSKKTTPGKEELRKMLVNQQPLLILIDELLHYVSKAKGTPVGDSNLGTQTLAFLQELTETVGTLEKVALVVTIPASNLEHLDEEMFQKVEKIFGRIERIYTPVEDNEITKIIRRRLFKSIDEAAAARSVEDILNFMERENIFPVSLKRTDYRDKMLSSYPFLPDVIEVLYQRWGSFPTFQRTRGVLRLLSLIIFTLKNSNRPYITLSDFDLNNQDIRQEFIKHIGTNYNGIIASDMTDIESGSKKIDVNIGDAFQGLRLGTRSSTAIFLHSFSTGQVKGCLLGEIKRSATLLENPASVITEVVEQLKNRLFYLQAEGERLFFSHIANLNHIILNYMDNVNDEEIEKTEKQLLQASLKGEKLKDVYIWEDDSSQIADDEDLKLVVLRTEGKKVVKDGVDEKAADTSESQDVMRDILSKKGLVPRVFVNTIIFIYPSDAERLAFVTKIKEKISYDAIKDKEKSLNDEQKKDLAAKIKRAKEDLGDAIRRYYRLVALPAKDGTKPFDLGIPTSGDTTPLDRKVYQELHAGEEILEKIDPITINQKYMLDKGKSFVSTEQIYQASLKTPGEFRFANKKVLEDAIKAGVAKGTFGLGLVKDDMPTSACYKGKATVSFTTDEVLIASDICVAQLEEREKEPDDADAKGKVEPGESDGKKLKDGSGKTKKDVPGEMGDGGEGGKIIAGGTNIPPGQKLIGDIHLAFQVPQGKVSGILGIMNFLQQKYENLEIEIRATGGEMSPDDFENKIDESFNQNGVKLKKRELFEKE
jgi:predicted AAA+ superfamily ATPase